MTSGYDDFDINYVEIEEPENCEFCGCIMGRSNSAIELDFGDEQFYFCSEECAGDYRSDQD